MENKITQSPFSKQIDFRLSQSFVPNVEFEFIFYISLILDPEELKIE